MTGLATIMALGVTNVTPSPLLTSLISYWKLDEASGTRVDSHGSNDLTDNNTVTQSAGKIGNAAQFTSGNSEYLSRANNASLDTGDIDFTWTCWIYADSLPAGDFTGIIRQGTSTDNSIFLSSYDFPGQKLYFDLYQVASSVRVIASTFGVITTGVWYFVCIWHDSAGDTINISVNNGTADSTPTTGYVPNTGQDLEIGNYSPTSYNKTWPGRIDEIGFWKRTLTSGERTQLYNAGAGLAYPF